MSLRAAGEGELIAHAIETRRPTCAHGIVDRPEWEHIRPLLVRSSLDTEIVIPVVYQGYTFGVFVIYAEPTDVGDREREVLSELGSITGYAVASESSRSLSQTNEQVRLKVLVKDDSHPLVNAVDELETSIDIEYLEMESDCRANLFLRISGPDRPESLARLTSNEHVFEVTSLTKRGDEELHKVQLTDDLFRAASALHLKIADAHVDQRGLVLSVDIAPDVSPRSVVDPMSRHVDELQVLAKETAPKSGGSIGRLSALISQIMTDRQYEVLECAYDAGFFDWPREQTAEEVANRLGISQPTFSQHLRTAQRHVLEEIFETDGSTHE